MGLMVTARKGTLTTILEQTRLAKGLTQAGLAGQAHVSRATVNYAEAGRSISLRSAMRLTVALLGELGPASDPDMLFQPASAGR